MRVAWSWLRELVALDSEIGPAQAARALTSAGLEVESVDNIGHDFSGVVVAQVVGKRKHPSADRLTLVDVIDQPDGSKTEVVCGASNVPDPGGLVLWARPGAVLPGTRDSGKLAIGTRTLQGVVSHGMICSEDEIGLGDDHSGIVVLAERDVLHGGFRELLGDPAAIDRLGLRDTVLDVGVHANRPDLLGHVGIARELAALFGSPMCVTPNDLDLDAFTGDEEAEKRVTVAIEDPAGCPRYIARVIDRVTPGPSPRWMAQRLRAMGARPISNLVDITNYVMFHYGQPLHAFDYATVAGAHIAVRRARAGERMTTLDDVERVLEPGDLLICDGSGPVALAGVMGGQHTEVGPTTTSVLLETASFEPVGVRRTARRLVLHSEASQRFGRGVDPNVADAASRMAAGFLARFGGGEVARGAVDAYVRRIEPVRVAVRASRASLLCGIPFERAEAARLLARLGIAAAEDPGDPDVLHATCPTFRPDLTREVDLIEEVIRLHGVHRVPATLPPHTIGRSQPVDPRPRLARRALLACGLSETITFGFLSRERLQALALDAGDPRANPIAVRNPMSQDQAIMRTALLPSLLAQVAYNQSFGLGDIQLYELGSVFLRAAGSDLADEPIHVAGVMTGQRPGWLRGGGELDFYDLKGVVDRLVAEILGPAGLDRVRYSADASVPYLHPGLCAALHVAGDARSMGSASQAAGETLAGHLGEIHPATRERFGIDRPCFGFELALAAFPVPGNLQMAPVPRYPAISRDISLFVPDTITAGVIAALIAGTARGLPGGMTLERTDVLEEYRDPEKVPAGKKGMLWSLTYRSPDRTLTDAEVNEAHGTIESVLLRDLSGAERR